MGLSSSQNSPAIPSPQVLYPFSTTGLRSISANSGSQLPSPLSEASLDPEAFLCSVGKVCFPSVLPKPQTSQKETLRKRPPIDPFHPGNPRRHSQTSGASQELPASHPGPFSRGLLRRATPQEPPPVKNPQKGEHPLLGTSSGALSAGPGGEPPGCFPGSAQRHPSRARTRNLPPPQSSFLAADSGDCSPPSPTSPALGLPPAPRPQGLPGAARPGCGTDFLQLQGPLERAGSGGGATPL